MSKHLKPILTVQILAAQYFIRDITMVKKFEELDRIPDAVILKVNQIALKFESFYLVYSKHVHKALSCQLASFRDGLS